MRKTSIAAAAVMLALGTAACSSGDAGTHVDFGYIGDFNGASLLAVADEQGLWKKHGIDAKASVFTNGPLQIQALGTGDLDFGYIGPGAMWLPATGKAKVVAMNTLGNADRVIAQAGTGTMADLKGKTIGVPEGTSGDMILTLALKKAGLTKTDVKIVPMDAATIVSAFTSKQIDAAGFWYPAIATIKKAVPDLVELAKNEDFADTVSFPTAFVAGNDVVAKDQGKTQKVIAVLRDAIQYRSDHLDETIAATAKMLNQPAEQVKADAANSKVLSLSELDGYTKDGTIDKWLTGMNDYFVGAGKLTGAVAPKTYYTADLFTGVAK
ncbi:aliphatic sulfonate ABC transporter substrate-binding protein [Nonomuraea aurantiaca]|uniref:aliphatic sulfonate ABC transporter substrate-binding protein n=1 Tax=Nonomuraea aurantiaca TaxID=2878562 RepID=UPI001CD97DAA|nr:aliphatic sulfonate ABC transporter substrate-binding protein [Nonomuraea aurantiaca]MCA2225378.1 aliphatic sulfonate ABC transporter substrate-binding protein [Nonomuraea aurantiaca]